MAKKGGVQQLQADISTDDEFEKFLDRQGLLVMDVYTEWCGPCVGMVSSLKKIKLELGGDNLQLAICKSDTITALERFRNKSEPTWLFASNGKAVNLMFGTNVPKLLKLIKDELNVELAKGQIERIFYNITDLQPPELERLSVKLAEENNAKCIEEEAAARKRHEYLTYVTNEIMKFMPDFGVTIFGPHINRDLFKKINDQADSQFIQCKDRRVGYISPDYIETLHFGCTNPMPEYVWKHICNKEILICLWKKSSDTDNRSIDEIIKVFIEDLTAPQSIPNEQTEKSEEEVIKLPPIIPSLEIENIKSKVDVDMKKDEYANTSANNAENLGVNSERDQSNVAEDKEEKQNNSTMNDETKDEMKNIIIPGVWAPENKRGHASAIYILFRPQTAAFLPPDPETIPPHVAIAFDAYKRKNIFEVCKPFQEAIILYGYFTNSDPNEAELIANSTKKYETKTQSVTDQLVLEVDKTHAQAYSILVEYGPSHVSANTVIGEEECKLFFPDNYKTGEMEEEEAKRISNRKLAEKKKKKKKKKTEGTGDQVGTAVAQEVSLEEQQENEEAPCDDDHAEDEADEDGLDGDGEENADAEDDDEENDVNKQKVAQ